MSAVYFDQLIVNAAASRGITSKPLCGINPDNLKASCYTNLQFC